MTVTREEPQQIKAGQYWERLSDADKNCDMPKGELCIIVKVDWDEKYPIAIDWPGSRYSSQSWTLAGFVSNFAYRPDGAAIRDREIARLSGEAQQMMEVVEQIKSSVDFEVPTVDSTPLLTDGVQEEEVDDDPEGEQLEREFSTQTDLIRVGDSNEAKIKAMKKSVTKTRNGLAKINKRMLKKVERIEALVEEKTAAIRATMSGLEEMMKVGSEVVWTLNIYLGRGEQIVHFKEGEPASVDDKICFRQQVLFADEETALDAKAGGLDFTELDRFNEWLCKPQNLQQVLPESKGIIAFKPRRKSKDYNLGDTMAGRIAQEQFDKANAKTYFLIRNGENLYCVVTDLEVTGTLFPKRDEFEDFYFKEKRNNETGEWEKETLRPGSSEYAKRMKAADAHQRYYGRILLFVQGLIDRTKIFEPLQGEQVNLLSRKEHENWIQYIYDADRNLLPTGRVSFDEWLTAINAKLDVGHRVIGIFGGYGQRSMYDSESGRHKRITPKGASTPEDMTLHTIEGNEGSYLIFRYKRSDQKWEEYWQDNPDRPGWGWKRHRQVDYKSRATCRIKRSDDFIINFDEATVEDMEFYLTSRVDRHAYMTMFPLLETCIKLKKQEIKDEAPFRALLVGQIMKTYDVDFDEAESKVDELIKWWKFKNRNHRALSKNDKAALEMIVKQYGLITRRDEAALRVASEKDLIIDILKSQGATYGEVVYIGERNTNVYVVLSAHNKENLFVNEQIYTYSPRKKSVKLYQAREWRTVDGRRLAWKELYTSERWAAWRFDARKEQYLTDPEIEKLTDGIWKIAETRYDDSYYRGERYENKKSSQIFLPLALTLEKNQRLQCWFGENKGNVVSLMQRVLSDDDKMWEPKVGAVEFSWKRTKDGVQLQFHQCHQYIYASLHSIYRTRKYPDADDRMWANRTSKEYEHLEPGEIQPRLLWDDEAALEKFNGYCKKYVDAKVDIGNANNKVWYAMRSVNEYTKQQAEIVEFNRYITEREGDAELWDEEKKERKLEFKPADVDQFERAVRLHVFKGIDIDGWTVQRVIDESSVAIPEDELKLLPLDMVLETYDHEKEEESDDEDDE